MAKKNKKVVPTPAASSPKAIGDSLYEIWFPFPLTQEEITLFSRPGEPGEEFNIPPGKLFIDKDGNFFRYGYIYDSPAINCRLDVGSFHSCTRTFNMNVIEPARISTKPFLDAMTINCVFLYNIPANPGTSNYRWVIVEMLTSGAAVMDQVYT